MQRLKPNREDLVAAIDEVLAGRPVTRELLPAAGILVDRIDAHWRRRERERGVTITPEPPTTRAPEQLGPPPSEE